MFTIDQYTLENLGFVVTHNGLQVSVTGEVRELAHYLSKRENPIVTGTVCKAYAKAVSKDRIMQFNLILQAHIARDVEDIIADVC